jgi:hypothetical protein
LLICSGNHCTAKAVSHRIAKLKAVALEQQKIVDASEEDGSPNSPTHIPTKRGVNGDTMGGNKRAKTVSSAWINDDEYTSNVSIVIHDDDDDDTRSDGEKAGLPFVSKRRQTGNIPQKRIREKLEKEEDDKVRASGAVSKSRLGMKYTSKKALEDVIDVDATQERRALSSPVDLIPDMVAYNKVQEDQQDRASLHRYMMTEKEAADDKIGTEEKSAHLNFIFGASNDVVHLSRSK